jgi:hypothetical protein
MGNFQGLVHERGIHLNHVLWITIDSTVELPVMISAVIKASLVMALILIILNWML